MSMQRITVAVIGAGPVAALITRRIQARADLQLADTGRTESLSPDSVPQGTHCAVYLPTVRELTEGAAAQQVTALLRAGVNVVTTAPSAALGDTDLLAACREGGSTFHGTGGFQSSLVTRVNRAFAAITRNIRDIELIEELDIEDTPAHPWTTASDAGLAGDDPLALQAHAQAVEAYYDAGLHTLSAAVFGDEQPNAGITVTAHRVQHEEAPLRGRARQITPVEQVVVRRMLGDHVAYDSIWTHRQGSATPLRYRLNTTSADAVGHATLTFHAEGEVRPADHLTCVGLLDALQAVHKSAPGILRHDLEINHVKSDERFAH